MPAPHSSSTDINCDLSATGIVTDPENKVVT